MSPLELRASLSLASIFGLRLLGMFVILPVFAIYAEQLPGGDNLTLVGVALGAYGLTQAILQIPFGGWSDRFGRKPVIYAGLSLFAAGSFLAAAAPDIYWVVVGRILQGAGAISAAVMAMAADLTREEHRAKAMAMIGSTIGLAFAFSLVASPWLNRHIGVPGIFAMTGGLALAAMLVVWRIVPDDVASMRRNQRSGALTDLWAALIDPQLARLNYGVFALHAVLMALFIAIPFSLRDAGLPLDDHWQVYLAVMLGSFVLMLPAVMGQGRAAHLKHYFRGSVVLLVLAHVALPWLEGGMWRLTLFLLVFFTPFNILEALLPTLTSKLAAPGSRGVAIGLYSSLQFLGTFVGAVAGGYSYEHWGLRGVVIVNTGLLVIWFVALFGMRALPNLSKRSYTVSALDPREEEALVRRLRLLPGVREAYIAKSEGTACLQVDSAVFDEQNALRTITGK